MLLLAHDPKKSSISAKKRIVGEKDEVTEDEEVELPTNKDGKDELILWWSMK